MQETGLTDVETEWLIRGGIVKLGFDRVGTEQSYKVAKIAFLEGKIAV
jgi:hypothetical protein